MRSSRSKRPKVFAPFKRAGWLMPPRSILARVERAELIEDADEPQPDRPVVPLGVVEASERHCIPAMKAKRLDELVASGRIGEADRERARFVVRVSLSPPGSQSKQIIGLRWGWLYGRKLRVARAPSGLPAQADLEAGMAGKRRGVAIDRTRWRLESVARRLWECGEDDIEAIEELTGEYCRRSCCVGGYEPQRT